MREHARVLEERRGPGAVVIRAWGRRDRGVPSGRTVRDRVVVRADHHPPGRRRRCEGIDEREDVLERDPVVRGAVRLDHDAGDRAQLLLEVRDRLRVIRVAGIARAERREGDHVIVQLRRVDALEDRGNGSSRGRGRGDHGHRRRGARHGRRGVRGCRGSRGLLGGWRRRAAAGGEHERKKSERPPHHDGISRARGYRYVEGGSGQTTTSPLCTSTRRCRSRAISSRTFAMSSLPMAMASTGIRR